MDKKNDTRPDLDESNNVEQDEEPAGRDINKAVSFLLSKPACSCSSTPP